MLQLQRISYSSFQVNELHKQDLRKETRFLGQIVVLNSKRLGETRFLSSRFLGQIVVLKSKRLGETEERGVHLCQSYEEAN